MKVLKYESLKVEVFCLIVFGVTWYSSLTEMNVCP